MRAAMGGLRGVWVTVGASSPKRVPAGARALSGGARSARAGDAMFPVFQGRAGVIESNDLYVVAAETEEAHAAQSVANACAAQPRVPRELLFVPSEAEHLGGMFPVFNARGGVVESNAQLITEAETEAAHAAQSVMDASAAQQHLPRELFFVPSETPMIFESLAKSASDPRVSGKTVEVNGMRFFLVDDTDAAPAAGGHP
ncbi:hypothetical protein T484DRAFT_1989480 [Baffinella frigidus]|nr:hypothetical protein T484DRAFT_1989480 [Cryptophyta sp. CCMP2293]